jgi:hypothetical protein
MPNIGSVIKYFPFVAENTVAMSLSGDISPRATTIGVTGMTNYSNGDYVVFTVDAPTASLKQVFTGQVEGANVVNCVWTYGTNQAHATGAPVIDYVSATTIDMISQGIQEQHNLDGTHEGVTNTGGMTTDTLTISGVTTGTGLINANGGLTVPSGEVANILAALHLPVNFHVYRNAAYTTGYGFTAIPYDTAVYDNGSNVSLSTGLFTAPYPGYYRFSTQLEYYANMDGIGFGVGFIKNGSASLYGGIGVGSYNNPSNNGFALSAKLLLAVGDTVGVGDPYGAGKPVSTGNLFNNYFQGEYIGAS